MSHCRIISLLLIILILFLERQSLKDVLRHVENKVYFVPVVIVSGMDMV